MLGGGKADACYCAAQIRKNESPAPSPPVAPRRMQQSCSSMTCHKHEGKHTWSNTLQRGRRYLYCLWEFTQQRLMEFHFRFYRAIKWSISSPPSYFLAFQCDHTCSVCKSLFLFSLLIDLQPDSKLRFPLTPKGITLNLSSYQQSANVSKQSWEKNIWWKLSFFIFKSIIILSTLYNFVHC